NFLRNAAAAQEVVRDAVNHGLMRAQGSFELGLCHPLLLSNTDQRAVITQKYFQRRRNRLKTSECVYRSVHNGWWVLVAPRADVAIEEDFWRVALTAHAARPEACQSAFASAPHKRGKRVHQGRLREATPPDDADPPRRHHKPVWRFPPA